MNQDDRVARGMEEAIRVAEAGARMGNVPVGAVVEIDGQFVARSSNLREVLQDPTAHAELLALSDAARLLGRWRLPDATLYVTLEPCAMCAGAIAQARVGRVIYAAIEPKMGAIESVHRLLDGTATETSRSLGHSARCAALLSTFFEGLRQRERDKSTW